MLIISGPVSVARQAGIIRHPERVWELRGVKGKCFVPASYLHSRCAVKQWAVRRRKAHVLWTPAPSAGMRLAMLLFAAAAARKDYVRQGTV